MNLPISTSKINLRILCELIVPLNELQQMIGLSDVKDKIVDQNYLTLHI